MRNYSKETMLGYDTDALRASVLRATKVGAVVVAGLGSLTACATMEAEPVTGIEEFTDSSCLELTPGAKIRHEPSTAGPMERRTGIPTYLQLPVGEVPGGRDDLGVVLQRGEEPFVKVAEGTHGDTNGTWIGIPVDTLQQNPVTSELGDKAEDDGDGIVWVHSSYASPGTCTF